MHRIVTQGRGRRHDLHEALGPRHGLGATSTPSSTSPARSPVEDLVSPAPGPSQVVTSANFNAGRAGAQVTGGGDSRPMQALALVAELLGQNKLVIKVQTFPFERAAEAYRISQGGHVRGKLVLVP